MGAHVSAQGVMHAHYIHSNRTQTRNNMNIELNSENTGKFAEVITAFNNGKRVEYLRNGEWYGAANLDVIIQYFSMSPDYVRVVKETRYIPYNEQTEFIKDSVKHGLWMTGFGEYFIPHYITRDRCVVVTGSIPDMPTLLTKFRYTFTELYNLFKWVDDGTPCGKLISNG